MVRHFDRRHLGELNDRLRSAHAVTPDLMAEIIGEACQRFPPIRRTEQTLRIERFIGSGAWLDATLGLIDLELPQWRVRRIAYDEGEWHCALSRQRELPVWLDQSIEGHHPDLPLAVLSAFVDAWRVNVTPNRPSVPVVVRSADRFWSRICCDNFV
jgi:hypothetical protein